MELSHNKKTRLINLCWVAYFATYLCRLNYSAVMPQLDGIFSESQLGTISSVFFICYGFGQLVSGYLGDRLSPRYMVAAGISISSLTNIALFFFNSYSSFIILWAVNGCVQSMVWSPLLRIAGENLDGKEQEKFSVTIASTVPLGTLASYGISLLTLAFLPWKYVFLSCGVIELFFALIWFTGTRFVENTHPVHVENETDGKKQSGKALVKVLKLMATSGLFMVIFAIMIQGTLKDSVTQWIPTFFSTRFQMTTTYSLLLTMILPIINVTGAYFASALYKKLHNEFKTSFVFFAASAVLLCILQICRNNVWLSLLCMAGVTNCMFAINVMLITMLPLRLGACGCVSTIGGILNAVAYIGCGALNIVAGFVLEKSNGSWDSLFTMWLVLAVTAGVITVICIAPYRKTLRQIEIYTEKEEINQENC